MVTDARRDIALAGGATVAAILLLALRVGDGEPRGTSLGFGIALVAAASLAILHRAPTLVLGTVAVARIVVTAETGNDLALYPALAVALYVVAQSAPRGRHLPTAAAAALVSAAGVAWIEQENIWSELLGEGALALLPVAVADATRARSDRVAALVESESAARVQAERLRIARDLHDIVAHGLSMIAVQSGVAAHRLETDPALARDALTAINHASRQSLDDLRSMVGVLRSTDTGPLTPIPSNPDDLAAVVANARSNGVPVTVDVAGSFPPDAAASAVIAVHRIAQEALNNVERHAGAVPTVITLQHTNGVAVLRVTNDAPATRHTRSASTGVGLIGMKERAESLGGTLTATPAASGGFVVEAVVPHTPEPTTSP